MKPLGPARDSISLLYDSQLSDLAATSLVSSGLSPTSASRDDSTSSKLLLLSNLRRTPLKGISRGLEPFKVDIFIAGPKFIRFRLRREICPRTWAARSSKTLASPRPG